ncbi:MAG: phosphotransferase family protein [Pyrinomonadaceae bacterium]
MTETKPVRPGEEIDAARLKTYLGGRFGMHDCDIIVEQFPGGSSNLTYLIRAGTVEYVLRRPPFGNTVRSAHDMKREFDVLSKLAAVYPPAPKPFLYSADESVIGSEFYLMERRKGLIIRGRVSSPHVSKGPANWSTTLDNYPTLSTEVCRSFIQNLADLHALDYNSTGLDTLGKPLGYNRRQVEGWTKRYFAAKTDDWPELEKAIIWLNDNIPAESGAALIHNDYKFDNIMLDPDDLTRITAVLDWEMVTVGDPLMDLGTTLGYWMSADAGEEMLNMPFNPRELMESISRQDLVEMYGEASGRDVSNILFYYVFGTFKIAVIAQQIYGRYIKGFTRDPRFASFNEFVGTLGRTAAKVLESGTI